MMGADDSITFGGNTQTGPVFGTAGSLLCKLINFNFGENV